EYAELVVKAKESFRKGDLFEVVPGQKFMERCDSKPSDISKRLKAINPSPYSFFINLGNQEYLVGASPEMFVRVSGRRIETCPISGTIKRGDDPIADSEQILKLLNSKKDESELTMCSDVDRNDKSRVCVPGSVKVIGRRQIEMYSRLIHTVDHIEGRLRDDMDAFDGFLSHAWAVTVTGAPKLWAMRFIEAHEKSPRAWYGGAIGMVGFNGDMNTGLTLRTIRIKDGIAEVRAGATLLNDSNPEEEEVETELKASAMIAAIRDAKSANTRGAGRDVASVGTGVNILLVDHEDSFVHTLANYFRQTGATVTTVRTPVAEEIFDRVKPDLVVLSPGPGMPKDFDCKATIKKARARDLPIFGVCLGLQALAEAYGGDLRQLAIPMHGKPSRIRVLEPGIVFSGLGKEVTVGRYHSIFADPSTLPREFMITAESDDGTIMGIEHMKEPIAAVQFHPESIMTLGGDAGMRMIENVVAHLVKRAKIKAA
ncbi:MAG: anthranilate synthase, partial [Rhizobium giardinii]